MVLGVYNALGGLKCNPLYSAAGPFVSPRDLLREMRVGTDGKWWHFEDFFYLGSHF